MTDLLQHYCYFNSTKRNNISLLKIPGLVDVLRNKCERNNLVHMLNVKELGAKTR